MLAVLAVVTGFYVIGSDALSFHFPGPASNQRPRILISGTLFFAAVCFFLGTREHEGWKILALGYAAVGMAAFTFWVITSGMEI